MKTNKESRLGSAALALAISFTMLFGSIALPRRSEAAMALILTAFGGTSLVGGVAFLGSVSSVGGAALFARRAWRSGGATRVAYVLLAAGCLVGAFYALEAPQTATGELKSLSDGEAARLGLSESEHRAYEQELAQLNAVREEVILSVAREFPDATIRSVGQLEQAAVRMHEEWARLASVVLSEEAISAVQKLSLSVQRSVQ